VSSKDFVFNLGEDYSVFSFFDFGGLSSLPQAFKRDE